jgi:hypothetical protein
MRPRKYTLAAVEMLLVFPAVLFMTSLFVRNIQPQQYEPAHTAQQIVDWYAARPILGLGIILIALPLTVLVTGGGVLWRNWSHEAGVREAARQTMSMLRVHLGTFLIACATVAAAGVLAIVALHLAAD